MKCGVSSTTCDCICSCINLDAYVRIIYAVYIHLYVIYTSVQYHVCYVLYIYIHVCLMYYVHVIHILSNKVGHYFYFEKQSTLFTQLHSCLFLFPGLNIVV